MSKVFISHSSQDQSRIEKDLLPLLRSHGIEYWYSSENIPSASDWEKVIRRALSECEGFLVALSAHALRSDWLQAEVHWALDHRKERFVSLLLDDCTPSEIHLKLIRYQHVDWRQMSDAGDRRLLEALRFGDQNIPQMRLDYRIGGATGQIRRLVINDSAFIGRTTDCAIHLPSNQVSRRHGLLKVRTDGDQRTLWLADLGSTNGIRCNGQPVQGLTAVTAGDCVDICGFQIEILAVSPLEAQRPVDATRRLGQA